MTKSKGLIVACLAVVASLGALAAPASARPVLVRHHHPKVVYHHPRVLPHHHPRLVRHPAHRR